MPMRRWALVSLVALLLAGTAMAQGTGNQPVTEWREAFTPPPGRTMFLPTVPGIQPLAFGEEPQYRVVVLLVDGVRKQDMPLYMPRTYIGGSLAARGTFFNNLWIDRGDYPTATTWAHVALLGGWADSLGSWTVGIYGDSLPQHPMLWHVLQLDYGWQQEKTIAVRTKDRTRCVVGTLDERYAGIAPLDTCTARVSPGGVWIDGHDSTSVRVFRERIATHDPWCAFGSLWDTDYWGHKSHPTDASLYFHAMQMADTSLSSVIDSLEALPQYHGRTYYIVMTDHGRDELTPVNHGDESDACHLCWALVIGPNVRQGHVTDVHHTHYDMAALQAMCLGAQFPDGTQSLSPPVEIFETGTSVKTAASSGLDPAFDGLLAVYTVTGRELRHEAALVVDGRIVLPRAATGIYYVRPVFAPHVRAKRVVVVR